MADNKPDKKPDKRKVLRELADKFTTAMVQELLAHRKHLDSLLVTQGARTPTAEERAIVQATKQGWLAKSRERILILGQMEDLLGIVHKPGKSARQHLDQLPDDPNPT